jgi:hypothetical protein
MPPDPASQPRLRTDLSGTGHPNLYTSAERPDQRRLRADLSGTGHPNLHANVVVVCVVGGGWR